MPILAELGSPSGLPHLFLSFLFISPSFHSLLPLEEENDLFWSSSLPHFPTYFIYFLNLLIYILFLPTQLLMSPQRNSPSTWAHQLHLSLWDFLCTLPSRSHSPPKGSHRHVCFCIHVTNIRAEVEAHTPLKTERGKKGERVRNEDPSFSRIAEHIHTQPPSLAHTNKQTLGQTKTDSGKL